MISSRRLVALALALWPACRAGEPSSGAGEPASGATDHSHDAVAPRGIAPRAIARAAQIERALEPIDAASLRADVQALAADSLEGRATPSPGLDAAAAYVVARMESLGLASPPGVKDHRQVFACGGSSQARPAANLLAEVPGRTDARVIVSAHYDHVGTRDGETDGIYNGANDDASGVAGALAIVGAVARLDPPPLRTVTLVAFCGEELGLLGSAHFVAEPPVPLSSIDAVINLEMLGRPTPEAPGRVWITGAPLSTLGEIMAAAGPEPGVSFVDAAVIGAEEGAAFDRADNYSFARLGIVAHTFATGRIDALYHSPDDEADTIDYAAMAPMVRSLARGVIAVADAETPPRWTAEGAAEGWPDGGEGR